jgi:hypothetical protein
MSTSAVPVTSGRAIASLILGVLSFVLLPFVGAALAIWLGVEAKREIRNDPTLGGEGLATAGIILGIVQLVLVAVALLGIVVLGLVVGHMQGG